MRTAKAWQKTNDSLLTQFANKIRSSLGSARDQLSKLRGGFDLAKRAIVFFGQQAATAVVAAGTGVMALSESVSALAGTLYDVGRVAVAPFNAMIAGARNADIAVRSILREAFLNVGRVPVSILKTALFDPIVNTATAAMQQFNRRIIQGAGLVDPKTIANALDISSVLTGVGQSQGALFATEFGEAIQRRLNQDLLEISISQLSFAKQMSLQFRVLGDFVETQFVSIFSEAGDAIASVFTGVGPALASLRQGLRNTGSFITTSISEKLQEVTSQSAETSRRLRTAFGDAQIFKVTREGIEIVTQRLITLRNTITSTVVPAFARLKTVAGASIVEFGLTVDSVRDSVVAFGARVADGLGLSSVKTSFAGARSSIVSFTKSLYAAITGQKIMQTSAMGVVKTNALLSFSYLQQQVAAFKAFVANEGLAAALMHVAKTALFAYINMLRFAASQLYTILTGITLSGIMNLLTLQAVALNGALGGLPLLLGAIVTAGAAMVGIIGQGEGPVVNLRNGFNRLKEAIFAIIDVLVDIFVPIWNLFLDVVELLLSPIFAVVDGFKLILDALIPVNEQGDKVGESFSLLSCVIGNFTTILGIAGKVIDFFADIIYYGILIPFQLVASAIRFVISGLYDLYNVIRSSSAVQGALTSLRDIFQGIANFVDAIFTRLIDGINNIARKLNRLPFVDIGTIGEESRGASQALSGARVTTAQTMENISGDTAPPGEGAQTSTQPAEFNFNEYIENNTNVDAQPEDKQRIKGLVESALKDANTYRRQRDGRSG